MADIKVKLGMDAAEFAAGAAKAKKAMKDLATAPPPNVGKIAATPVQGQGLLMSAGMKAATAAMAAVASVMAVVAVAARGMYAAMEAGGALIDLSAQTGLAVDKLMVLQTAFEQAGLGADSVQPIVNKMQKAIVAAAESGGEAAKTFDKLGISASSLSAMNAEQQMQTLGAAINGITNPAERSAAAMEIFGKSGGKMLALFAAGGLDDAAKSIGAQAALMKENAGIFDRVTDVLGQAAKKLQGLYVGMAAVIAPMLMSAVEAFNAIDLSGIGQDIGAVIAIIIEAFSEGKLGSLVFESLKFGFVAAVNFLSKTLSGVLAGVIQFMVERFSILTEGKFWEGLTFSLVGAAQAFIEIMANGVAMILDKWKAIPLIGKKAAAGAEALQNYASQVGARSTENLTQGKTDIAPLIAKSAQNVSNAAKIAAESAPQIEQTSALKELSTSLITNVVQKGEKARKENPTPLPAEVIPPVAPKQQPIGGFDFVSSLTKIGGNMFGPSTGGDEALSVAREQLKAQEKAAEGINQTNIILKMLQGQTGSSGVVYG